jgi:hypothetical protein
MRRLDGLVAELAPLRAARRPISSSTPRVTTWRVIRGAMATLEVIVAMQSELSVLPLYQNSPDYLTTIREITDLGFTVCGLYPIRLDERQRAVELDGIFVQTS